MNSSIKWKFDTLNDILNWIIYNKVNNNQDLDFKENSQIFIVDSFVEENTEGFIFTTINIFKIYWSYFKIMI